MDLSESRVAAVIVAYHPEEERLMGLLAALAPQVDRVFVVDNTPASEPPHVALLDEIQARFQGLELLRMGHNVGIGKALNEGISGAIKEGFDFVYLSDQDSRPEDGVIRGLLDCHTGLASRGVRVGCVCPAYHDTTTGMLFNFQADVPGKLFYLSVPAVEARPYLELVTTISSGSLVSRGAIESVGPMREDFFIDYVDTEWCHRARYNGFRIFGTSEVRLLHRLGDDAFRIWAFGWRLHNLYSPTRIYYRFRNYILMSRLAHVPWRWTLRSGWYWLGNLYAYTLFAPRRLANAKAIVLGVLDGLLGRAGQCRWKL